jgi:hypothetical protein
MKGERAFLKKLAQNEIGVDEFYEKELKYSKTKKNPESKKKLKSKWD